jgi:hypothetical protein
MVRSERGLRVGTDLSFRLRDRPGSMAELCERLADAGVVIEGICGLIESGLDVDHLLVRDEDAARAACETAGGEVLLSREVLVVEGARGAQGLAAIARRICRRGGRHRSDLPRG